MSRRDCAAGVLSLKKTVLPRLTLMSVANPWMLESPAPLTSHCEEGLPGRQFSASMALAGDAHEATAAGVRASKRKVIESNTPSHPWRRVFTCFDISLSSAVPLHHCRSSEVRDAATTVWPLHGPAYVAWYGPGPAANVAHCTPLRVLMAKATGVPLRARPVSVLVPHCAGTIACNPLAPTPTFTVKPSVVPSQVSDANDDAFRPSSHVSICRAETIGTPRACAEARMASEPDDSTESVCMLAVKTP